MSGAGIILFVLWVAISNLVLGFALAIAFGHGPRRVPVLSDLRLPSLKLPSLKVSTPKLRRAKSEKETATPESENPTTEQPNVTEAEPTTADTEEIPAEVEMSLDAALAQFQEELAQARGDLDEVNERVEACTEAPTVEAMEWCVADLKGVGNRILDEQAESLKNIESADNAGQTVVRDVQEAAAAQASQIRETLDEIDQMEINPETLEEDCQRLRSHTNSLTASCDAVDQSVSAAKSQIDDEASRQGSTSESDGHLVQMSASEALEHWWADDPEHQRPLTMVMIDLDGVKALNDALGKNHVDALLAKVEKLIVSADTGDGRASQVNPQRFLILVPNADHQKLTRVVEALREEISTVSGDEGPEIPLTASCAIAVSRPGDSARNLVARAEAALLEAKQFGGNRTFLNEGEFPTPVVASAAREPATT